MVIVKLDQEHLVKFQRLFFKNIMVCKAFRNGTGCFFTNTKKAFLFIRILDIYSIKQIATHWHLLQLVELSLTSFILQHTRVARFQFQKPLMLWKYRLLSKLLVLQRKDKGTQKKSPKSYL